MIMRGKISGVMSGGEGAPVKIVDGVIAETPGAITAAVLMDNDCAELFDPGRKPEVEGGRDG